MENLRKEWESCVRAATEEDRWCETRLRTDEVFARNEAPDAELCLRLGRLRFLPRLMRAPKVVFTLLHNEGRGGGAEGVGFFGATILEDLRWLTRVSRLVESLGDPEEDWAAWARLL